MSRLKMVSSDGSYLHEYFLFKGFMWRLIGTISGESVLGSYDEFKSEKGQYKVLVRRRVKELCELKEIQAVNQPKETK